MIVYVHIQQNDEQCSPRMYTEIPTEMFHWEVVKYHNKESCQYLCNLSPVLLYIYYYTCYYTIYAPVQFCAICHQRKGIVLTYL